MEGSAKVDFLRDLRVDRQTETEKRRQADTDRQTKTDRQRQTSIGGSKKQGVCAGFCPSQTQLQPHQSWLTSAKTMCLCKFCRFQARSWSYNVELLDAKSMCSRRFLMFPNAIAIMSRLASGCKNHVLVQGLSLPGSTMVL